MFITSFFLSFIHLFICSSSSCCLGGGVQLPTPRSKWIVLTCCFSLISFDLAQIGIKTPPTTRPLISNDRLSLNIGINYGDVKFVPTEEQFSGQKKEKKHTIGFELHALNSFKAMVQHSSSRSLMSCCLSDLQDCKVWTSETSDLFTQNVQVLDKTNIWPRPETKMCRYRLSSRWFYSSEACKVFK